MSISTLAVRDTVATAATPSSTGMRTSSRTTSGCKRATWSIASCPVAACPTTWMSPSVSSRLTTPMRMTALSSVTSTRIISVPSVVTISSAMVSAGRGAAAPASGAVTRTVVPWPGRASTVNRPSTRLARSLMPTTP